MHVSEKKLLSNSLMYTCIFLVNIGVNVFSQCEEEKVTLVSHEQLSQIQLQILQSNSNAMVNVSRCEEENELPVTHSNGFHTVEVLKGSNITVEIDNNSENCDRTSIYVPDLKPTG